MASEIIPITNVEADTVLSAWLGRDAHCDSVQPLHGGMIHSVLKLRFDSAPHAAVVKISRQKENPFAAEAMALRHLKERTQLPVPHVYACSSAGTVIDKHVLLMEFLEGETLGTSGLTKVEREQIDCQLAEILLALHSHSAECFGSLDGTVKSSSWLDYFRPRLRANYEHSAHRLPNSTRELVPELLEGMDAIFASQSTPTLVHGDIWVTNVLITRTADGWRITGLIDPSSIYADVEFELAYMEAFQTVGPAFFKRYCAERQLREGYEQRRLYYWLSTMLRHVELFGDQHFVERTDRIARQLQMWVGSG